MIGVVIRLALRDVRYDRRLFFCFVVSMASIVAPLLVLAALKTGVIAALRQELLDNPATREIILIGNRNYDEAFYQRLKGLPAVAFVIPRTRSISASVFLSPGGHAEMALPAELIPTATGDPLLQGAAALAGANQVIVSRTAADMLHLKPGEEVVVSSVRRHAGQNERLRLRMTVADVAPAAAVQRSAVFADMSVLFGIEDFLDDLPVDDLTRLPQRTAGAPPRLYASFRLFARRIEDVEPLAASLNAQGIDTRTRADQIQSVLSLDHNLTIVFSVVATIGGIGFVLGLGASLWANVERKVKELALIRLLGVPPRQMMVFPIAQSIAVALLGFILAAAMASATALVINALFVTGLPGNSELCRLTGVHFAVLLAASLVAALSGASFAAWRSSNLELSDVLHQV